jgi:hypothetical protein
MGRGEPGGGGANGGCGGDGGEGGGDEGGNGGEGGRGGGGVGGDGGEGGDGGGGGIIGGLLSGRSGSRPMSQSATPAGMPISTVSATHTMQHVRAAKGLIPVCLASYSSSSGCNPSAGGRFFIKMGAAAPSSPVHVAGGSSTSFLRLCCCGELLGQALAESGGDDAHTLLNVNGSSCFGGDTKRAYHDMRRAPPRHHTSTRTGLF